ncbi:MAG: aminotransferase class III-fold pyridoxal phosphate-dependent enzyme [Bacteroidota bacterium]|nr:aminotransferase class III-fold pyridoxal phosphate-dependent enzyme [Bacteroidota bacterium]
MKLFDVYPLYDIEPVRANGCYLWDKTDTKYLDLYGGHAVISVGHTHPYYVEKLSSQLKAIGFYSNAVKNSLQVELAEKLGKASGYDDYSLFLCNSGAEANENALKLASFHTGRKRVISFGQSFHGRTSLAVSTTDNPAIVAPVNAVHQVSFVPLNDAKAVEEEMKKGDVCAVIIEGIQGIGGIRIPKTDFMHKLRALCDQYGVVLILDEIQSGYGRSGKFFAHQYAGIKADLITLAKGMGNGFPIGGVMIGPQFEARYGMLGTTFGGNHLACAAAIAVLDIMEKEQLVENAAEVGKFLMEELNDLDGIREVRGEGLIIGLEFDFPISEIRKKLLFEKHIFTGYSGQNTIRILPPLTLTKEQAESFVVALSEVLFELDNK